MRALRGRGSLPGATAAGASLALLALGAGGAAADSGAERPPAYVVTGDGIGAALGGHVGDAGKGAELLLARHRSLCLLCHTGPFAAPHLHGDLGPDLSGVGGRLSAAQLRLRIADMPRLNGATLMPSFLGLPPDTGEARVGRAWRGRPILDAREIEDLVAYLRTLR